MEKNDSANLPKRQPFLLYPQESGFDGSLNNKDSLKQEGDDPAYL